MAPATATYLISYDIADPGRLRRVHRRVQSQAFQLLESLYLLTASAEHVGRLWQQLQALTHPSHDKLQFLRLDNRFPLILGGTAIPASHIMLLGWPDWCSVDDFLKAHLPR